MSAILTDRGTILLDQEAQNYKRLHYNVFTYNLSMVSTIATLALAIFTKSLFFLACSAVSYCLAIYCARSLVNSLIDIATQDGSILTPLKQKVADRIKKAWLPKYHPHLKGLSDLSKTTFGGKSLCHSSFGGLFVNDLYTGADQPVMFIASMALNKPKKLL